jgi:hypothetical protein
VRGARSTAEPIGLTLDVWRCAQFRTSTGESWNYLMADLAQANEPPLFYCTDDPQWNDDPPTGCGSAASYIILLSFTLIVSFVMMNLFVAVILGASTLPQRLLTRR